MGNRLYIYCNKYQNWDEIFIYNEIKYLTYFFKNIEIIPLLNSAEKIKNELPQNTILNLGLSNYLGCNTKGLRKLRKSYHLLNLVFLRVCFQINPLKIKSLASYFIRINEIKDWCQKNMVSNSESIHYTYWFTEVTSALCLSKKIKRNCRIISRAHRFDLFDKYGSEVTNFFKQENFKSVDKVFTISTHGYNYLRLKFPQFINKVALAKLGSIDPGFISHIPGKDKIRIFSCSLFVEVKRIYLIVESLKILAEKNPEINIEWIHAGTGILEDEIKSLARKLLTDKVKFEFLGFIPNSEVFRIYQEKEISVLLNVSEVEGISVSFMEAQSCGVPVIASSVGGTPEIINNENGLLLSANPSPEEIAEALYDVYLNHERWNMKRRISRKNWEENFNAEKNYEDFSKNLLTLIN